MTDMNNYVTVTIANLAVENTQLRSGLDQAATRIAELNTIIADHEATIDNLHVEIHSLGKQ